MTHTDGKSVARIPARQTPLDRSMFLEIGMFWTSTRAGFAVHSFTTHALALLYAHGKTEQIMSVCLSQNLTRERLNE